MGLSFYIACHACKKKMFLLRGEEHLPLHKFYRKHYKHRGFQVQGDYTEEPWMDDYEYDELMDELYPEFDWGKK